MNARNSSNAPDRAPTTTTLGCRGVGGAPDTPNPLAFNLLNPTCRGVGLSAPRKTRKMES